MASIMEVKNELYAHLSGEVRQELAKYEHASRASRGTILVQCGIPLDRLIILNSGSAETSVPVGDKTLPLGIAGPGKILALHSILSGEAAHTSVTCLEECGLTVLPREAFLGVLSRNPQMYFAIVKILSSDLAIADGVIRDRGRSSLFTRSIAALPRL